MHPTPAATLMDTRATRKGPLQEGGRSWDHPSWSREQCLNTHKHQQEESHEPCSPRGLLSPLLSHMWLNSSKQQIYKKQTQSSVNVCRVLAKWGWEITPEAHMESDHCLLRILLPRTLTSWHLGGLKQLIHMEAPSQSSGTRGSESLTTEYLWPHKNLQLVEVQKATTR